MRAKLPYWDKTMELALNVAFAIRDTGHSVYVNGGQARESVLAVLENRDLHPAKDIDMCTSMPVSVMKQLIVDAHIVPTGEQYGTLTFVKDGVSVEVTQYRKDFGDVNGPTDNRKEVFPTFSCDPVSGPHFDVARRDLTINGLLIDPFTREVIDYVGGVEDLCAHKIKFIGGAVERCREDALRLLRAIRFAARYDYSLSPEVFDAAEDEIVQRRLKLLSAERVRDEFLAIMSVESGHNVAWALTMLAEFGVLGFWFPELVAMMDVEQNIYHSHDVWGHTLLAVEQSDPNLYCRLFALFHDIGKPPTQEFVHEDYGYSFHGHPHVSCDMLDTIFERLRFGQTRTGQYDFNTDILKHLVGHHMDAFIDGKMSRMLKRIGIAQYGKHMLDLSWRAGRADFYGRSPRWQVNPDFRGADEKLHHTYNKVAAYIHSIENPVFSTRDLQIDGRVVMQELQIPPGPVVGEVLKHLLATVQDNLVANTQEELLSEAKLYWRTRGIN